MAQRYKKNSTRQKNESKKIINYVVKQYLSSKLYVEIRFNAADGPDVGLVSSSHS